VHYTCRKTKGHALERLRIVLPSLLFVSLYFTEVYSAQSVSTPRPAVASKGSVAEKFPCPQCKKKFSRREHVNRHVRAVHEKLKPFQCTQCKKNFSRRDEETRHVKDVHNKERPFQCTQCDRSFVRKVDLTRHVIVHGGTNERLPCDQCKRTFTRKDNLTQHVKIVHKLRRFHCTKCDKNFTRNGTLKRHRKSCSSGKDDRVFPIEGYHPPAEADRSVLVSSLTLLFQDPSLRLPAKEIESDCDGEDYVTLAELPDDFIC
jgi:uncharacterized Zn-finger protein